VFVYEITCNTVSYSEGIKNAMALVRERTILTERPLLVGEVSAKFADRRCCLVCATDPHGRNLCFLDRSQRA
jgi:hypothetical protein